MSAAELRKAAETLRELTQNTTPAPWRHTDSEVVDDVFDAGLVVVGPESDPIALVSDDWYEDQDGEPTPWHDATYIATMHPGVGLALADWLDDEAKAAGYHENRVIPFALTIARLINGGAA